MKRLIFACAVVLVVTGPALASVHRVIVTKETQSKSGIEFSLTVEPVRGLDDEPRSDGYSRFTLSIPGKQKPFEHLWRTELWILEKEKGPVVLSVPVALRQKLAGEMTGEISLSSKLLEHAILAFRCGKNAPLAETIYQVELKTYFQKPTVSEKTSFRIYLLADGEPLRSWTKSPLAQLKLSHEALFTEADIIAYDWTTHEITVSDAAIRRMPRPKMLGTPFVVVANGERIYAGAFFSCLSSASLSVPVIVTDPIPQNVPKWGNIRIDRAYPTDDFAKGTDHRKDSRIRACLAQLEKLREKPETAFENKRGIGDELVPLEVVKELPRRIEKLRPGMSQDAAWKLLDLPIPFHQCSGSKGSNDHHQTYQLRPGYVLVLVFDYSEGDIVDLQGGLFKRAKMYVNGVPVIEHGTQSTVAGLRMSISAVSPEKSGKSPVFRVSIENAGNKDAVLNLGTMLANGTVQRPDAIRLVLIHPQSKELHWRGSKAGVGGRVDDYVVPLRVGSIYSIKLSLENYWCPATKEWRAELDPGNYRIYAKFEGQGAVSVNGDMEGTKLMPFWKGQLQSNVATFTVAK